MLESLIKLPVNWLLTVAALLAASRLPTGIHVADTRSAVKAAICYPLLSLTGHFILSIVLLPLFAFLPNALIMAVSFFVVSIPSLYATEAFVKGFEVDDLGSAAKAAALIVAVQMVFWFWWRA